jgi:hypothetical protein
MELQNLIRYTFLACSIGTLAACSSADNGTSTPTSTTVSGSIFAAPVSQATVTVKKADDPSTDLGTDMTANDGSGSYSIDILTTDLETDLVFVSTGGSFIDEATQVSTDAKSMSAYVTGGTLSSGDSVHITPGTTIKSGLRQSGISEGIAHLDFFNAFAYIPDISVQPVVLNDPSSFSASDASRHIGFRAAVFSKLAQDIGLDAIDQFDMFDAMAQDLMDKDGTLDGKDANGNDIEIGSTGVFLPADIRNKYFMAVGSFTNALTETYNVEYSPLRMTPYGRSEFELIITRKDNGSPVNNLGLADLKDLVMPTMYMDGMTHGTPVGSVTHNGGNTGTYAAVVYYLMPTRMMMVGNVMGSWDLKVMAGMGETAHFYPNINMNGNNVIKLLGINDMFINMEGDATPRNYFIFNDGVTDLGGNTYKFDLFIALRENMMRHPALEDDTTYDSGVGLPDLVVAQGGITVEVSIDGGTSWGNAIDQTNGLWSIDIPNLTAATAYDVMVRLTVNNEIKESLVGGLDHGTFSITTP